MDYYDGFPYLFWKLGMRSPPCLTTMTSCSAKTSIRGSVPSRTLTGSEQLRDYSQAVDVGSLKGVNAATIRILVWVLSFLAHGYATEEFEVTEERLGVYRPEEHIDNPLGYGEGKDARQFDPRLRGPVDPREVEIDPHTGMKNYIANESGGWATSSGYLRFSFARSIHFGRLYTSGSGSSKGKEADLCEALRCLGQALHCMEVSPANLPTYLSTHPSSHPLRSSGRILKVNPFHRTSVRTATTASSSCVSWVTMRSSLTAVPVRRSNFVERQSIPL